ncbi:wd g-beta repeat-containing protein, partial [Cystoisospora suis]
LSFLVSCHLSKSFLAKLKEGTGGTGGTGGGGSGTSTPESIPPDDVFLSQLIAVMFGLSVHPRWSACSSLILSRLARANFSLFIKVMGKTAK